jgi:membrane associated rhomboid family serine protease
MEAVPFEPQVVERRRLFTAALLPGIMVLALWVVYAFDRVFSLDLARFGIMPRTLKGLLGILITPFVHADLEHLFNNSAPVLVLGWMLVYFYPRVSGTVVIVSWLIGGIGVWATARENYHIGASGVVYGLAGFLFVSGLIRGQRGLLTVSMIIVFLYGSMWWGLLPLVDRISYESHFFGAFAGVVMAIVFRKVPPAHVAPAIVFTEDEDDEHEHQGHHVHHPGRPSSPTTWTEHPEGDEVEELAMRRRLAEEAARIEGPDPFGPAYRSSFTHPGHAYIRYDRERRGSDPEDDAS